MRPPDDTVLPDLTDEGFLRHPVDWNDAVAEHLAFAEGITLNESHWEILHLLRDYYRDYDSSPAMRALVKYTKLRLDADKGRSIYLMKLFPGSPAKIASKLAGLPKPANCL